MDEPRKRRTYPCIRCGVPRTVHDGRCPNGLCRDCIAVDGRVWRPIAAAEARRWHASVDRMHASN